MDDARTADDTTRFTPAATVFCEEGRDTRNGHRNGAKWKGPSEK